MAPPHLDHGRRRVLGLHARDHAQAGKARNVGLVRRLDVLDPMASIAEARRDLSLEEAVDAWSVGSAYAEHAESRKGELREGLAADIAIVDFESAQVKATVVGGRLVYEG